MERKNFIAAATTLTAGAVASTLTAGAVAGTFEANTSGKKQLVHHVFFWLKNPDSITDRDKLVEGVKTLAKIETIRKLHVGVVASTEKREVVDTSWGVSELMYFDDEAGQKVYQDHPIHQDFIKNYSHLWSKVIVYDAAEV